MEGDQSLVGDGGDCDPHYPGHPWSGGILPVSMVKVRVLHFEDAEDGGCGHLIEDTQGTPLGRLKWNHPKKGEDFQRFAEQFVKEELGEGYDLDWEGSEVSNE
jgi:hypothetical protein